MHRRQFLSTAAGLPVAPPVRLSPGGSTSGGIGPLGRVDLDAAYEATVGAGATVYVATGDGFVAVDVGVPTHPRVVAERDDIGPENSPLSLGAIWDVVADDTRLLAAGPAYGTDDLMGCALFDVSTPADPRQRAFHETDFPIHNAMLADGLAYLTGNNGDDNPLVIVDMTADDPVELGRWSPLDYDDAWADVAPGLRVLHDVWVAGDTAYCAYWDAGVWVVDVSDPTAPEHVSHFAGRPADELADVEDVSRHRIELPGNVHNMRPDPDERLLAINREAWDTDPGDDHDGGPGGVELWRIVDPTDPYRLARIEPPPTPDPTLSGTWTTSHNLDISRNRLYTSWYRGGIRIHDITDPRRPRERLHWQDRDAASLWTAQRVDRSLVVASDYTAGPGLYTFPGG